MDEGKVVEGWNASQGFAEPLYNTFVFWHNCQVWQMFYIVNLNTFTYVPSHERQAVRILEDAAQRDG
jgi:hypothetical protein